MIKIIIGDKGSGKSKTLIQDANEAVKKTKGHLVFVDVDNSHMFQIDYNIRFMGLKDYSITNEEAFYGFICGVIASNYDVEGIYIDGLTRITNKKPEELEDFFNKISTLELKYNVNFIFTIHGKKEELPKYLEKYIVQILE